MEEKSIEEQVLDAEKIPETPITLEDGEDKIATGLGAEYMSAAEVIGPGEVYIYDTLTHERSKCRRTNLTQALLKKRPDGSTVFTTVKPKEQPKRGQFKCMLHPEARLSLYDDWQLPVCMKGNLSSPFQVRRHMQKRHKAEYGAIQEEEKRIDKEEEKKLRRTLIKQGAKRK